MVRVNILITKWISRGLISDDYREVYDRWEGAFECEVCSHDFSYYKKCMDHCHVTGKFRNILCQACNNNNRIDNTSGIPNIYFNKSKKKWSYEKNIKKIRYRKWFNTKEEAIAFKLEFES